MIRPCTETDFDSMLSVINDSARAYRGAIPEDCCHEPYMSAEYLAHEIKSGVKFWGCETEGILEGIMGIQDIMDVTLIRHAYVRTARRGSGIGTELIRFLVTQTDRPTLIGTWKAAQWAIDFYNKHGFVMVSEEEKDRLLTVYWSLPARQVETSVVMVDARYFAAGKESLLAYR